MKFDEQQAQRILAGLRRRLEPRESVAERWDVPGLTCGLPARPDGESSVGDPEIDAAIDVVNIGSAIVRGLPDSALTDQGLVQLLSDVAIARRRLDAAYLAVVSAVDKRGAAKCSGIGAQTTAGLLKALAGILPGRAKADVANARALHGEPGADGSVLIAATPETDGPLSAMADLLAEGQVSMAHVDTAVRTMGKVPAHILDALMIADDDNSDENADKNADETDDSSKCGEESDASQCQEPVRAVISRFFVNTAPVTSPDNLRRLGNHLIEVLAPDLDDHFDPESFARRSMTMSVDSTGMVFGDYQLDPVAGAALKAILDPLSAPRPVQRDDDGNVVVRDPRTPEQRRADALSELVHAASPVAAAHTGNAGARNDAPRDSSSDGPHATSESNSTSDPTAKLFELETNGSTGAVGPSKASRLRPGRRPTRITVVTTAEKIKGTDRTPSYCFPTGDISPGTLSRLACDATFERLVLDAKGAVLDLGIAVRLASPAQKRAIIARDKGCVFPGCNRPATWCDVHHVLWYSKGGPTDVGNMALLCTEHHTLVHTGRWIMTMIDGIPYAKPAPGTIKVTVAGAAPTTIDTCAANDGWIRNSYFDRLKETEELAAIIVRERPDAA